MNEIIHVVDAASLSPAARLDLEVEAVRDQPLTAGYYFVLWTTRRGAPKKRVKRFYGPFRSAGEARLLATSALMLGLAGDVPLRAAIAECRSVVCSPAANDCYAPAPPVLHQAGRAG